MRPPLPARATRSCRTRLLAAAALASLAFALSGLGTAPAHAEDPPPKVFTPSANDGWFYLERIDDSTWAIREPHGWQENISYSICGDDRCILFDSGSPGHEITFVHSFLTKNPTTVFASHTHYDHIGSHHLFESVAMLDIPENRSRMRGNAFHPSIFTSFTWPWTEFDVSEWWAPGRIIDLGGRWIEVMHAPGHSADSVVLVDRERGQMFVGDHIYPEMLLAITPGADIELYLESTRRMIHDFPEVNILFTAHFGLDMPAAALKELETLLEAVTGGTAEGRRTWQSAWMVKSYSSRSFTLLAWP